MNFVLLIGTLKSRLTDSGDLQNTYLLEVERNFAEEDGELISDCYPVELWRGLADKFSEVTYQNKKILVKGRLAIKDNKIIIIAEKVNIL